MSADELRKAAETLRGLANNTSRAPWVVDGEAERAGTEVRASRGAGPTVAITIPVGYESQRANAAYIATMHPGVGLALAKWLDDIAAGWMWDGEEPGVVDFDGDRLTFEGSMDTHALALARLINGGVS